MLSNLDVTVRKLHGGYMCYKYYMKLKFLGLILLIREAVLGKYTLVSD